MCFYALAPIELAAAVRFAGQGRNVTRIAESISSADDWRWGNSIRQQYGVTLYDDLAKQAARNPNCSKLVLGQYLQDGKGYTKVAAHFNATYQKAKTWKDISNSLTPNQLWRINEAFLDQQIKAGKQIILSHDPAKATKFFKREVNYLRDLGYEFEKNGWVWKAVRK